MAGIVLTEAYEIKRKKLFEKNKQNECCFVQMFVLTALALSLTITSLCAF